MANKVNIPSLRVEPYNELASWKKSLKRFQIATIPVNFGAKVTETDERRKNDAISKVKAAVFLSAIAEKGMAIFEAFDIEVDDL